MIDAHQHVWTLGKNGATWPTPAEGPIYRDYGMDDFQRQALALGIRATVLVQSQEDERDTDWLLNIAESDDLVAGVVGWTELSNADAAQRIAALAERPKLVGLRPMVQDREADWYDDAALDSGLSAMIEHGLALDALVRVKHLPSLDQLAARFPALRIVIDHAAKPEIGTPAGYHRWYEAIAPLARRPNVACKLSGLLTECGDAPANAIAPYAETILRLFGPDRVMWGSDWPVLELASTYSDWLEMARRLVPPAEHAAVFGGTAAGFYRLKVEVPA